MYLCARAIGSGAGVAAAGGLGSGGAGTGFGADVAGSAPAGVAGCVAAEPALPVLFAPESGVGLGVALLATGLAEGEGGDAEAAEGGFAEAALAAASVPGDATGWLVPGVGEAADEPGALASGASEFSAAAEGLLAPVPSEGTRWFFQRK